MIQPITDRATFASFAQARRARCGSCSGRYLPAPDVHAEDHVHGEPGVRVAFNVGRHAGNAVARNRIRRRLRAVMGELCGAGRLTPGAYLLGAGADAGALPYPELRDCVGVIVDRLCGPPPVGGKR